jgi:hypothetical protein
MTDAVNKVDVDDSMRVSELLSKIVYFLCGRLFYKVTIGVRVGENEHETARFSVPNIDLD